MNRMIRTFVSVLSLSAALQPWTASSDLVETSTSPKHASWLAGEFERQSAVLMGWNPEDEFVEAEMATIAAAACERVQVVIVVPDEDKLASAKRALHRAGASPGSLRFVPAPIDTVWMRDYGPFVRKGRDGRDQILDASYEDPMRSHDDAFPSIYAAHLNVPSRVVPLQLDGGNLLTNGAGLAITTTALIDANECEDRNEEDVRAILRKCYGLQQVVFLEPLDGEATGHVDMFATFVGRNTVVVGEYLAEIDAANSEILDRNAALLSAIQTSDGPLQVVRIPMPPVTDGAWRTYTNVLYANGLLLVPVYAGIDPEGQRQAIHTYQQFLPNWKVVPLDCTNLIERLGAIHCVTMNLRSRVKLPPAEEKVPVPDFLSPSSDRLFVAAGVDVGGGRHLPAAAALKEPRYRLAEEVSLRVDGLPADTDGVRSLSRGAAAPHESGEVTRKTGEPFASTRLSAWLAIQGRGPP